MDNIDRKQRKRYTSILYNWFVATGTEYVIWMKCHTVKLVRFFLRKSELETFNPKYSTTWKIYSSIRKGGYKQSNKKYSFWIRIHFIIGVMLLQTTAHESMGYDPC